MNCLFIGEPTLIIMVEFIYHPKFEKEVAKLKRRFIYNDLWTIITFLCAKSHVDNYKDNEANGIALERVTDIF